jgi:hypothetical protein
VPPLNINRKQKGREKRAPKINKPEERKPNVTNKACVLQELLSRQCESSPEAESEYYAMKREFGSAIMENESYMTPMYDRLQQDDSEQSDTYYMY